MKIAKIYLNSETEEAKTKIGYYTYGIIQKEKVTTRKNGKGYIETIKKYDIIPYFGVPSKIDKYLEGFNCTIYGYFERRERKILKL